MNTRMIFGRDPVLIATLLEGLVLAFTTFLTGLDANAVGTIQAVVTLGLALYVKWGTVTEATAVILQLGKALLVLMVTFGVTLGPDRQAVLLALLAAAVGAFTRTQVSAIVPPVQTLLVPGAIAVQEVR